MAKHQARYFHAKTEGEKNCAYPGIFWCQKDQHTTQYEQRYRQDSFAARILDHGQEKTL